jgi:cell division protein FtsA
MKTISPENLIIALDVGTTKICALIAQRKGNELLILGIGKAPSLGLARGIVVDIASAVYAIKAAVKEAELMAGCQVEAAYVGISGSHIQSINSHGMVPIKHGDVRPYDITHVIEAAQAIVIPEGQKVLHVIPQWYIIDGHQRVRDPLGMYGVRLEAQVHIITGSIASVQNLIRCCELAQVKVRDIILEPLASADAVISPDERELGVAMLDIGGGTSDFALYQHTSICHTNIFTVAGNLFTNDIALCLRTTISDAERIKKESGIVYYPHPHNNTSLLVETVNGGENHTIALHDLADVLFARAYELLELVQQDVMQHHLKSFMTTGLVLTGGGSLLTGLKDLAQEILGVPVRIGKPRLPTIFLETLENPMYATAYGLLLHALKKQDKALHRHEGPLLSRVFSRMKTWVIDFF